MILALYLFLLFAAAFPGHGQSKFSIGSGECDGISERHPVDLKTATRSTQSGSLKAYGQLTVTRLPQLKETCSVTYRLFVSSSGQPFEKFEHVEQIEGSYIAGIDIVGFSPDRSKVAANFWEAAGDWQGQGPAIFDVSTGAGSFRELGDSIQKKIHGCDQLEDFLGVTDDGAAVFAVPPSIYDDSVNCGDKGLWHFNPKTGALSRVARNSGVKWQR